MRLLALDLSSSVGWALLQREVPPKPPRFGTLRLTGDLAMKLGQFWEWIEDLHSVDHFDALAWERPLIKPTDKVDLLELLYGLVGIAYGFAGSRKLPWREVTVNEAKFWLTGKHNASKEEMVVAALKHLNWRVANDHEADAGAVGGHAYQFLAPKAA